MNKKNTPFFSIVIPTYNRAPLLERCLESLCNQTYKNFEVLVCDDGSTDNSEEVTKKYTKKLNIQYLWEINWGGPARPRNRGIALAKGEWICFLDSDDWWYSDKLEKCVLYLDDADLIYHSLDTYSGKGIIRKKVVNARALEKNIIEDLLLNSNAIFNSSVVVRKKIIDEVCGINEDRALIAVEDFDCWLRIAKVTNRFKFIPASLGAYWIGFENISNSTKQIERELYLFTMHTNCLSEVLKKEIMRRLSYRIGRMYQKMGNYRLAKENYRISLGCNDFFIYSKSFLLLTLLFLKRL